MLYSLLGDCLTRAEHHVQRVGDYLRSQAGDVTPIKPLGVRAQHAPLLQHVAAVDTVLVVGHVQRRIAKPALLVGNSHQVGKGDQVGQLLWPPGQQPAHGRPRLVQCLGEVTQPAQCPAQQRFFLLRGQRLHRRSLTSHPGRLNHRDRHVQDGWKWGHGLPGYLRTK